VTLPSNSADTGKLTFAGKVKGGFLAPVPRKLRAGTAFAIGCGWLALSAAVFAQSTTVGDPGNQKASSGHTVKDLGADSGQTSKKKKSSSAKTAKPADQTVAPHASQDSPHASQTKSTQSKSTQTKSTQTKSTQTKSTQTKSTQTKSTQTKSTQTKGAQTKKATTSASTASDSDKSSSTGSAAGTGSKSSSSKSKSNKKTVATASRRSSQQQPTPDRYREIQQALNDKGYFKGPVDGAWGPDSVEALKRFQRDQNLTEDGKIGALSLIALGLGPQRTVHPASTPGSAASPNPEPPAPTAEPSQEPQTSSPPAGAAVSP